MDYKLLCKVESIFYYYLNPMKSFLKPIVITIFDNFKMNLLKEIKNMIFIGKRR